MKISYQIKNLVTYFIYLIQERNVSINKIIDIMFIIVDCTIIGNFFRIMFIFFSIKGKI